MAEKPEPIEPGAASAPRRCSWELGCESAALAVALLAVAAVFLLLSPLHSAELYPGTLPWRSGSVLRTITAAMSLGGLLESARGVEAKDLALHLAAAAGLMLVGLRLLAGGVGRAQGPVAYAQGLLGGWVLLSLASSAWSGDAALSSGQALMYAVGVAWAVALAELLTRRSATRLLVGIMGLCIAGAMLAVWYYYERNPDHRPLFPVGNPTALAAAVAPGILLALFWPLWGRNEPGIPTVPGAEPLPTTWRVSATRVTVTLLVLIPLLWCFALAQGRGAQLGLLLGLGVVGLTFARRWVRWVLAAGLALIVWAAAAWWLSSSQLDLAMARGATIRFRLYAWRYAAELWSADVFTQFAGQGAGAYPRLAGLLAVEDRVLDPAPFMGFLDSPHNELFHVLAEIGLIGGLTYVGGLVATAFAVGAALRRTRGADRWGLLAATGALVTLLGDALTGAALRLPGVPILFFTLLGIVWALSSDAAVRPSGPTPALGRIRLAGILALLAGLATAGLAWQNWAGVRAEVRAMRAEERGDFATAATAYRVAQARLIDPPRILLSRLQAVRMEYEGAVARAQQWASLPATTTAADPTSAEETWRAAVRLGEAAFDGARQLAAHAPAMPDVERLTARSAELLMRLYAARQLAEAGHWSEEARQAWLRQRKLTPFDVEALLSLEEYPATLGTRIALMRDALREGTTESAWLWRLARVLELPGAQEVVGRFIAAVGPITPQSDLDAINLSMAPETRRLAAAVAGLRGDFDRAAVEAGRAAELYAPLKSRLPLNESRAWAEQAEYLWRSSTTNTSQAIAAMRRALDALPVVQTQQRAALELPLRRKIVFCHLLADDVDAALAEVKAILGPAAERAAVEAELLAVLRDAAAGLVARETIDQLARTLCPRFPSFCPPGTPVAP
ncbi:MAG: O-antigen ligase family protein [Phycisphaerales bacterium]|nr:O-antigen ligase family protein [Phycisphaerales bacterium]